MRAAGWPAIAELADARITPALGREASATQLALHPVRDLVAATCEVRESVLGPARAFITLFGDGAPQRLREGWLPCWSPDGVLAHLDATGVQVGELHRDVTGHVERLAWHPAGTHLLLVVAEPGAELGNLSGSGLVAADEGWLPSVEGAGLQQGWRRLVTLDVRSGELATVGRPDLNVWDACWAGDQVLATCSDGDPAESAWWSADLRLIDPTTGVDHVVATPDAQVGAIAASPSGRRLAWVTSVGSDRDLMAGDLHLLDLDTGSTGHLAAGTDVSDVSFVDEHTLGFAGLHGLLTRIGTVGEAVHTWWESLELTAAGAHPTASFRLGRSAFSRVGFGHPAEVVLLGPTGETVLAELLPDLRETPRVEARRWTAPDGLEVEGWLQRPAGDGPHPLLVVLHGGPIASHRPGWSLTGLLGPWLLAHGYAILLPNPRGSSGRGQDFARRVVGDMGGADATDVTSGITALIDAGLVDPARVGVTGGSYGGFLAAWLVTQTDLFAAAVPMHPITDWVHQHGSSNIPAWDERFLAAGHAVERSPVTHVADVRTPTLFLVGGLDRATPPGQALAMQRALSARGVPSACVTYPLAGHGAGDLPSTIDRTARTTDWLQLWMPATPDTGSTHADHLG